MTVYSHSKVSSYEKCPYQFKLKYIDGIKTDILPIEFFLGSMVHEALEKLYRDLKFQKKISKVDLIRYFRDLWERDYTSDIKIAKEGLTAENYLKMGEKYISDYYDRMKPFDQLVILGLETQDTITLPDGNKWHIRIDKLGCDNKGNYYVCDYKTSGTMMGQEEADSDKQLAMYSIWVKDRFKDVKKIHLVWHMLAFNKDAVSERTDEELDKLQGEIVEKIKEIESATKYPRNVTLLCDYCEFRGICPSFKHSAELEKKDVKEFKKDEGLKLVDEYSEVRTQLSELKKKDEELKTGLIQYSKQFGVDVVYGSNKKASVKEFEKIVLPEGKDKDNFIQLMKDKGLYDECSILCYPKINSRVLKGEIDDWVKDKVKIEKDFRVSLSKRKDICED